MMRPTFVITKMVEDKTRHVWTASVVSLYYHEEHTCLQQQQAGSLLSASLRKFLWTSERRERCRTGGSKVAVFSVLVNVLRWQLFYCRCQERRIEKSSTCETWGIFFMFYCSGAGSRSRGFQHTRHFVKLVKSITKQYYITLLSRLRNLPSQHMEAGDCWWVLSGNEEYMSWLINSIGQFSS